MCIAYGCVLIAAVLPYVFAGYAKFSVKGYDNSLPRDFCDKLQGKAKRSHYAHLNSFEAFPFFAISVIVAHLSGVNQSFIDILAVLWVFLRIGYGISYILDKSTLRSILFGLAFLISISLFVLSMK